MELSTHAIRVLGCLMEKARTTPEVYPLTLNSLVNACNQKTSRDPVTDYDEDEVLIALDELRERGLVMRVDMAGSRTAKFRENASAQWELEREEYALLCTLFLRGPQTPGQLRQRSERLHDFAELQQVSDWLQRMQTREEEPHQLVVALGRPHGSKEIRYAHTFCPPPEDLAVEAPASHGHEEGGPMPGPSRLVQLEARVAELEARVEGLEKILHDLTS